jgi:hypothetical protein
MQAGWPMDGSFQKTRLAGFIGIVAGVVDAGTLATSTSYRGTTITASGGAGMRGRRCS